MNTPDDAEASGGLRSGSHFAGCLIERELGRGGAGIVYLARDEALDRQVALKVLHGHSMGDDPASLDRFRNEAQIAAKLEHPSIIPIYSTGVDRGRTYLVMRYIPGRSLASYLNDHAPMPVDDALRLLRPVAAALDYAADYSVVHRDVKPANIFVDEAATSPRTLLGDFGIARAYEGTRHTATGGWVGTPDYIAPEILKDDQATARADQYSLACVLVECISGVSPFRRSNTAATITAQVTETPDLDTLPNMTPRVAEALAIALEKNPADRYGSCTEFIDAMGASLTGDAQATPATIVRRRKRSKVKRRVKIAATVAATVLGLLLGIAQVTGFNAREWLDGGTTTTDSPQTPNSIAQAAAGDGKEPAAAAPDAPDVLILGNSLSDEWSSWPLKKGVTAPDVVAEAIAQNPKTVNYRVKRVALETSATCAQDVKAAQASMPTKAIVVLDSPCAEQVVKIFGSKGITTPPIYVLSAGFPDLEVARAYLEHAPSDEFPEVDPDIAVQYGEIDKSRFVPLNLPSGWFYEAGVVARHYGRSECVYVGSRTDYATEYLPGVLQAGLRGSNQAEGSRVRVTWFDDAPVSTSDLDREIGDADCVVIASEKATDERQMKILQALKAAAAGHPTTLFILVGYPDHPRHKPLLKRSNVVAVEQACWLPFDKPQDRYLAIAGSAVRDWSKRDMWDDRAELFFVSDLIAGISKDHPKGAIPPELWIDAAREDSGDGYALRYPKTGVEPRPWGFVSGCSAVIADDQLRYYYISGLTDPDLSGAPELSGT